MPMALAVALAGALGAAARYGVDFYAGDRLTPHHQVGATLAVNVVGSLLVGVLNGVRPDAPIRIVAGIGFLGAFTTFSTLAYQTHHALTESRYLASLAIPGGSVVLGVAAVALGLAIGHRLA